MQIHSYSPPAPLSFFIEVIWFAESKSFDYANLTLPMLHHEMVINFSDRFEVSNEKSILISNQTAWLAGLQAMPIRAATGGKHFTMGVLFKPCGLYALTGIDAIKLLNRHVPLEDVFGTEAKLLTEEIAYQTTPARMVSVLEQFLLKKLNGRIIPAYLIHGLQLMQQAQPSDRLISRIAEKTGVSPKTLIQAFKKYIGLTPGKFHHLLLLNQLLHHLAQHPLQKLTGIGYDHHFFDQAHFIHFFRTYTGFTPSQYIQKFKEGKVDASIPHAIEIAFP